MALDLITDKQDYESLEICSPKDKIFSAELVTLKGQIPYLCWIPVYDTGYTD